MKPITGALVRALNETQAGIALTEARSKELPIELGQLRAGTAAVDARVDFNSEPADFRAALLALAEEQDA